MATLLATKIGVQLREPRLVARPRLVELLDSVPGARLILVSAPAGFGKTTLLADWIGSTGIQAGWLTLDAGDNDPARFLGYLRAAVLAACRPGSATTPESLGPADPDAVLGWLIDALAGLAGPVVLVLDDMHFVDAREIHDLVARLIERLPANARLAIATRADPRLPLARLRARGELVEVRAEPLRFTTSETAEFLHERMGVALAAGEIATLTERTEGWAAALQMAGISLRGRDDPGVLIEAFRTSHRFILDFVAEEVLAGLPSHVEEFLLRTSVLEWLTGPLCDSLTGRADGVEVLDTLFRANVLLVRLDDEGTRFRYHGLFRDLLRARLAMRHPGLAEELELLAARWHDVAGNHDESIEHALRSGDLAFARDLIRRQWGPRLHGGEPWTVQRWMDRLPAELVRSDAALSLAYGWAVTLQGRPGDASPPIADAERALAIGEHVHPFDRLIVPSGLASLRARIAEGSGDTQAAMAHARRALDLIPDGLRPEHEAILRGDATMLLGDALRRRGDLTGAANAYREAIPLLRHGRNVLAASHAVLHLARIEIGRGHVAAARALCADALDHDSDRELALAPVHLALAETLVAAGQTDDARVEARRALDLARLGGDVVSLADTAALLQRIGDSRTAPAAPGFVERLTERELEVLRLVAVGRSNRQIALELVLALGTVKTHVHSIMGKLGAANRVEAIARARDQGLLPQR